MISSLRPDPRHAWAGTLDVAATIDLEVRRSRFIAHLARCADEAAARSFVEAVRQRYPDARHHCSASVVAVPGQHDAEHSSDDGEPAGTAGRPMLDTLKAVELGQVCVVVVRYFGGVLLGTGGLVRAYAGATRAVLTGLSVVRVEPRRLLEIEADHGDAGVVEHALQQVGIAPAARDYTGRATRLTVAVTDAAAVAAQVAEVSAGRAHIHDLGAADVEVAAGTL